MANSLHRTEMRDWPLNLLDAVAGHGADEQWDHELPPDIIPTICYVLAQIGDRESTVLYRRYHDLQTMEEVGQSLGIGKESIRRIESMALRRMRHPSRMKWLTAGVAGTVLAAKEDALSETLAESAHDINEIAIAIRSLGGIPELVEYAKMRDADAEKAKNILGKPIDVLDLPARAWNCLSRAGIDTCEKLADMSMAELYHIRNLGNGTAIDIQKAMHRHGLRFRDEPSGEETAT